MSEWCQKREFQLFPPEARYIFFSTTTAAPNLAHKVAVDGGRGFYGVVRGIGLFFSALARNPI